MVSQIINKKMKTKSKLQSLQNEEVSPKNFAKIF
jgi:hypothetical protein